MLDINNQINTNTVILVYLNAPLMETDKSTVSNIHKEISELNYTLEHMDLTGTCKVFFAVTTQDTFFYAARRTFSKIDPNMARSH